MRKTVSIIIAVVLCLSAMPLAANAIQGGNYEYEVISQTDKTCRITDYYGSDRYLEIPETVDGYTVVEIGDYAFAPKDRLSVSGSYQVVTYNFIKTVTIPDTVKTIGEYAFYGINSLTEVKIPDSVKTVDEAAFMDCVSLNKINLPDSITFIGRNVVYNTKYIEVEVTEDDFIYYSGVRSIVNTADWPSGVLYIDNHLIRVTPDKKGNVTVKSGTKTIAGEAFYWCDKVTGVTIPNGVVTIGEYAFYNCDGLTKVTLPESVTSICEASFEACDSLKSVNIPSKVKSIGEWAFSGCHSLTSVTIPGTITTIGKGAYCDCKGLKTLKVNSGVKTIGTAAFQDCTALTSITLPNSITSIGEIAFYETGYYNTASKWTGNVLYIGNYLIKVRPSVSGAFTVRSGTKTIASDAFSQATAITSVSIPDSVVAVARGTFKKCTALKSISVSENNAKYTSVDGVMYTKKMTAVSAYPIAKEATAFTLPDSVTSVTGYAFYGNKKLKEVVIPEGVTALGDYAFYGCKALESVKAPESLVSVGDWAFSSCPKLTIYGQPDSVIENYATENEIPFKEDVIITPPVDGAGDVNGDGRVTAIDARITLQASVGLVELTEEAFKTADVNGDGKITAIDARWILQISVGIK